MGRRKMNSRPNRTSGHTERGYPQQMPNVPESFRNGDNIGTEGRNTEFKLGPTFIQQNLRSGVAKYVSAFINSGEEGKLLVGITDEGDVKGYEFEPGEEDRVKRCIDDGIRDIDPQVFPENYRVSFIPVVGNDGFQLVGRRGPAKVIEIFVSGSSIDRGGLLFQTHQGVFMRRDGGVQELKARDIQEWIRRSYQREMDRMRNNETNMEQRFRIREREMEREIKEMKERLQITEQHGNVESSDLRADIQKLKIENQQLQHQLDELTGQTQVARAEASEQRQTAKDIKDIKRMLEEQAKRKSAKSKVCVVS